jgi:ABC-2 type transport system permease protein
VPASSRRQRRRAFFLLLATEAKLAWRTPVGIVFGLGLPALLLVIFGSIPATTHPRKAFGGVSFFNLYVPTIILLVLLVLGLLSVPMQLATHRQQGVLRRMWTTPLRPSFLLGAELALALALVAVGIAIVLGVGAIAFGLVMPRQVGGFALSIVLSVGAMFSVGLCVAALAGTAQAAQYIGSALFYPLAFFSGLYVPVSQLGSSLISQISEALPSGAAYDALYASFQGRFPSGEAIGALAGYTVVFSAAALRWFRWDVEQPRARDGSAALLAVRAATAPMAFVSHALTRTVRVPGTVGADEVTRVLREALSPRYDVLPGRKMKRSLLGDEPAGPDFVLVKTGLSGLWRADVHTVRSDATTTFQVRPGGDPIYSRFGVARKVLRALQDVLR